MNKDELITKGVSTVWTNAKLRVEAASPHRIENLYDFIILELYAFRRDLTSKPEYIEFNPDEICEAIFYKIEAQAKGEGYGV